MIARYKKHPNYIINKQLFKDFRQKDFLNKIKGEKKDITIFYD
jgi:hypothetical protein